PNGSRPCPNGRRGRPGGVHHPPTARTRRPRPVRGCAPPARSAFAAPRPGVHPRESTPGRAAAGDRPADPAPETPRPGAVRRAPRPDRRKPALRNAFAHARAARTPPVWSPPRRWRADSQAVACSITFLGGRQQGGPKISGDDELFVIPRSGKASWFRPGAEFHQIESNKRRQISGKPCLAIHHENVKVVNFVIGSGQAVTCCPVWLFPEAACQVLCSVAGGIVPPASRPPYR